MENIDHISFEQASAELLEKVHHTLSAFRQRFEGEDVDFAKLHRELVKRVNDELDVQPCHPEVVEVRPKVLDCDVVRFQNNKTSGWRLSACSMVILMKYLLVCSTTRKASCCPSR